MHREKLVCLETVIDHLSGEEIGAALEELNAMKEILDAVFLTGIGKKNRPAGLLQALCLPEHENSAVQAIFRHTHTLGIRRIEMERYVLPRRIGSITLDSDTVGAKLYELEDDIYIRPEADELRKLGRRGRLGMPAFRFRRR